MIKDKNVLIQEIEEDIGPKVTPIEQRGTRKSSQKTCDQRRPGRIARHAATMHQAGQERAGNVDQVKPPDDGPVGVAFPPFDGKARRRQRPERAGRNRCHHLHPLVPSGVVSWIRPGAPGEAKPHEKDGEEGPPAAGVTRPHLRGYRRLGDRTRCRGWRDFSHGFRPYVEERPTPGDLR